jgi:hypothetical protein
MVSVTNYFKIQGPTWGNSRYFCCSQSHIDHKPMHTNVHWFEHRFHATVLTNNFLYIIVFIRPWSVLYIFLKFSQSTCWTFYLILILQWIHDLKSLRKLLKSQPWLILGSKVHIGTHKNWFHESIWSMFPFWAIFLNYYNNGNVVGGDTRNLDLYLSI